MSSVLNKIGLFYRTVRYLKFIQFYYRLFYAIRSKLLKEKKYTKSVEKELKSLIWKPLYWYNNIYYKGTFCFLNITKTFNNDLINWNFKGNGTLWGFNLNYFDFLNQKEITKAEGLKLIRNYISQDTLIKVGKEPYPISLRGINWVKFLSHHNITDVVINNYLYNDYFRLLNNLEYHLLANHLLENGFSLLFGAYYFQNDDFYSSATKILKRELKEQILDDGGHYELSPMYHQIVLFRLLDCINLVKNNKSKQFNTDFLFFLEEKAIKMLSWLAIVTYKNGNIPMINDSSNGIAPTSKELFSYARNLELCWGEARLNTSGYRKVNKENYEFFLDVGNIAPSYQPAHSHSDTFSYELYICEVPFIVEVGTSTYEKNKLRTEERSTQSHNTVQVGIENQSEVWGGFRVGRRARVLKLEEEENKVTASHDGYKGLGIIHQRQYVFQEKKIIIKDSVFGNSTMEKKSYIHFHPTIREVKIIKERIITYPQQNEITVKGNVIKIKQEYYNFSKGFNIKEKAIKVIVFFEKELEYSIDINQ